MTMTEGMSVPIWTVIEVILLPIAAGMFGLLYKKCADVATESEKQIAEARTEAKTAVTRIWTEIDSIKESASAFKIDVARNYVDRADLNELKEEVREGFKRLTEKIDEYSRAQRSH